MSCPGLCRSLVYAQSVCRLVVIAILWCILAVLCFIFPPPLTVRNQQILRTDWPNIAAEAAVCGEKCLFPVLGSHINSNPQRGMMDVFNIFDGKGTAFLIHSAFFLHKMRNTDDVIVICG